MAKKAIFKPPYLPQMGADSPKLKIIFFSFKRAVTCMGQIGVGSTQGGELQKSPKVPAPQNGRMQSGPKFTILNPFFSGPSGL